jgi:hypothetical protein
MRKFILSLLLALFFVNNANALDYSTIHITRSLNYDAKKAGVSQKTIFNIVRIFSWRINFNKDLRVGD